MTEELHAATACLPLSSLLGEECSVGATVTAVDDVQGLVAGTSRCAAVHRTGMQVLIVLAHLLIV